MKFSRSGFAVLTIACIGLGLCLSRLELSAFASPTPIPDPYHVGNQPLGGVRVNNGTNTMTVDSNGAITVKGGGASGTSTVQGSLSDNGAAPSTNNLGTLPAHASASAPTSSEGKMVTLWTSLAGLLHTAWDQTLDKTNDSISISYRSKVYWTATTTTAAGVTLDAIRSLDINKGGTVTAAQTSYTITSTKTLRITSATFCNRVGAAAVNDCQFKIRNNTAGATVVGSALVHVVDVDPPNAVSAEGTCVTQTFPDGGLEFLGDSTNSIGTSDVCTATTNKVTISLVGYEFTAP